MRDRGYWKSHYVVETEAVAIERNIKLTSFASQGKNFELVHFHRGKNVPNILISPGSGGHSYVFAELAYHVYLKGYNVFIMPKHGGDTIPKLMGRHRDALMHILENFGERIGVFSEGLGGFVTFYLALDHGPMRSIICQNSPGILTERRFQEAVLEGGGAAGRRRASLPLLKVLVRLSPNVKLPISLYLDWKELIDTKDENREVETRLVKEGYLRDPDFDRWYPLSAIMSLVLTPPPRPLEELRVPTMFLVPLRGWSDPAYVRDLYNRLPPITKRMVEVDGGVYWMCSHPRAASDLICDWFDDSLS